MEISAQLREDVAELLYYNWSDEMKDYFEQGCQEGHIFETMVRIHNWINGYNLKPTDYAP